MSLPAPYAYGTLGLAAIARSGRPTQIEWSLGGGVGLTSRLWIDGSIGTVRLAPGLVFHSAQIGPNVLIVDTRPFELSGTVHVSAPADDGRPIEQIEPGFFAVARIDHTLRLDAGLYLDVNPGPTTTVGFRLPLALAFQLSRYTWAAVSTGATTTAFSQAGETTAVPAGITVGWSDYLRPKGSGAVGLLPSITFPELWKPWAKDPFRPGYFVVGLTFVVVSKY